MTVLIEQFLNGLQLGVMLFMTAAGLTLVFGVMNLVNLAHGSLYMAGAFAGAAVYGATGSFWLAILAAILGAVATGLAMERLVFRHLYRSTPLAQVLASIGIIFTLNALVQLVFGKGALFFDLPPWLAESVTLPTGSPYPLWRLIMITTGLAAALGLAFLINRTRLGMRLRAGASDGEMINALGVDIDHLFLITFGLGAALAGLAGIMTAPLATVESGMGEDILILALVVIVIGGIGSVKGAFMAAILVGMIDTLGRSVLPDIMAALLPADIAGSLSAALANMMVYLFMALMLIFRPQGLSGAKS